MGRPLVLPPLKRSENDARVYALAVHKGQADKAGLPFWHHLVRVHDRFADIAPTSMSEADFDIGRQAAWLHDVLEPDDRPFGRVEWHCLVAEGFNAHVVRAVDILTRKTDETYREYIERIATHGTPTVILVKIADLEDNLDLTRLGKLDPDKAASLRSRYEPALARLKAALAEPTAPR